MTACELSYVYTQVNDISRWWLESARRAILIVNNANIIARVEDLMGHGRSAVVSSIVPSCARQFFGNTEPEPAFRLHRFQNRNALVQSQSAKKLLPNMVNVFTRFGFGHALVGTETETTRSISVQKRGSRRPRTERRYFHA